MKLSTRVDNRVEEFLASSMRLYISLIVSDCRVPELSISALLQRQTIDEGVLDIERETNNSITSLMMFTPTDIGCSRM